MKLLLVALAVLAVLPRGGLAQSGGEVMRPSMFQPEVQEPLSGPVGLLERPAEPPRPPAADRVAAWRKDFVGKPVHDPSGRRLGEVVDVVVGPDGIATAVLIWLPGRHVAVPWTELRTQLGGDHVVLPVHYEAMVEGLVKDPAGLAGWRSSWLDGAPARLAGGGEVGRVDGFVFGVEGQVAEVMVRSDAGTSYAVPRERLRVEGGTTLVVGVERDELAQLAIEAYPPPAGGMLAELPR